MDMQPPGAGVAKAASEVATQDCYRARPIADIAGPRRSQFAKIVLRPVSGAPQKIALP